MSCKQRLNYDLGKVIKCYKWSEEKQIQVLSGEYKREAYTYLCDEQLGMYWKPGEELQLWLHRKGEQFSVGYIKTGYIMPRKLNG